jgi:hypothetical protein
VGVELFQHLRHGVVGQGFGVDGVGVVAVDVAQDFAEAQVAPGRASGLSDIGRKGLLPPACRCPPPPAAARLPQPATPPPGRGAPPVRGLANSEADMRVDKLFAKLKELGEYQIYEIFRVLLPQLLQRLNCWLRAACCR